MLTDCKDPCFKKNNNENLELAPEFWVFSHFRKFQHLFDSMLAVNVMSKESNQIKLWINRYDQRFLLRVKKK